MVNTVLVVDDEPLLLEMMCESFELRGFRVLRAPDGEAALVILQNETVDLLLTDIDMPKKSGVDLLIEFRRFHEMTPVFVITGGTRFSNKMLLELGATYCFEKPVINFEVILELASTICRQQRDRTE